MLSTDLLALFLIQLMFWIFLNFTRIGKVISAVWGSLTILGFFVTLYPSYLEAWKIGFSGDLGVIATFLETCMSNSINFLIQLVLPPWIGLLISYYMDSGNYKIGSGGFV